MLLHNNQILKKVFGFLLLTGTVLFANTQEFNFRNGFGFNQKQFNNDLKNIKQIVSKNDNYKSMIYYYSHSDDPKDWFALGIVYLFGTNVPDKTGYTIKPNIHKAEYWLLKATKGNFYTAGITLASVYMYNPKYSNKKNLKKAENILKYLIDKGYYRAVNYLADCYRLEGKYEQFLSTLVMGDQYNDSTSQLSLALLYYYGFKTKEKNGKTFSVERDLNVANYYLTKACTNPNKTKTVANFCNPQYNKNIIYERVKNKK